MHTTIFSTHHGINNSKSPPCTACSHDDKVSCLQAVTGDPVTCWVGLRVQTTEQDAFHKLAQLRGSKGYTENLTKRSNAIIINNTNLERMPCTHEREKLWTRPVANVCFAQKQNVLPRETFVSAGKHLLGTHTVGLSTSAHRFTVDVDIDYTEFTWIYCVSDWHRVTYSSIQYRKLLKSGQADWASAPRQSQEMKKTGGWTVGVGDNQTTECNRWVASRGRKAAGSESNVAVAVIPVVWLRASRESRPFHRSWTQRLFRSLWNHHTSCEMWTTSVKCGLLENVNNFYEFDDKFGNTAFSSWLDYTHTYIM